MPAVTDTIARRLAIGALVLTLAVTVATLALRIIGGAPPVPNRFSMGDTAATAVGVLQVATASVAALILVRIPRHRVGWLLMATGAFYAVSILAGVGAFAAVAAGPDALAIAEWCGWLAFVTSTISGITIFAIPFVFPDGRPASRRVARLLAVFAAPALVLVLALTLQPGPGYLLTSLDNPIGIGPDILGTLPTTVLAAIGASVGAVMALAGASVVARFRRSRGVERQQLKWFVGATILMTVALGVTSWIGFVANDARGVEWPLVAYALAATTVPISIGIAILRYRLYAIDRIISRTLSYGVITAVLLVVFVLIVVGLQALLASITDGQAIPVAVSTIVVFALFQPLRRRVQEAIDRRFNRARYDAERTQAAFAARLRDNVDLDSLGAEVRMVVTATMAPASVGLWLRPGLEDQR